MSYTSSLNATPSFHAGEPPSEKTAPSILSWRQTIVLISALNGTITIGAINTGMMTVLLPSIGEDLHMSHSFLLWPALIYSLTCGCTVLLSGAIADVIGNRTISLIGTFGTSIFIVAAGLARSGTQLLVFRAFQGISISMCFTTAIGMMSAAFPSERVRIRNIAFGCLGFGTPLGFAIGILMAGWFDSTSIGWRPALYFTSILAMLLFGVNAWCLPAEKREIEWIRLKVEIDWIGAAISSTSMGLLSYTLALMAGDLSSFREPARILLLVVALALIPLFILWMYVQEARGKPALIPNALWRNATFSAICIMVLLTWASLQGMEWFLSLFYQQVQTNSPIETAVRYMANTVSGSTLNILTGIIVHRVRLNYYVVAISVLATLSPLLQAVIHVDWSWWYVGFWVQFLVPMSVDVNYTVANLLISDIFPKDKQALAGAVYQTMSQLGISIGIAVLAVISDTVTEATTFEDKESPEALMHGFRAVSWTCFVLMVLSTLVGTWGLWGRKHISEDIGQQVLQTTRASSPLLQIPSIKRHSALSEVVFPPRKIRSKPLPPHSISHTQVPLQPKQPRTEALHSRIEDLPDLPTRLITPNVEVSFSGDTIAAMGSEARLALDDLLQLYNHSRRSSFSELGVILE